MKKLLFLSITIFITATALFSQQDVEEMMRKIQEATQKEMDKNQKAVEKFISKNDSLFAAFLEKEWEMFQAFQGIKQEKKPKPKTIPTAPQKKEPQPSGKPVKPIPIIKKEPIPKPAPIFEKPQILPDIDRKILKFLFYDLEIQLHYNKNIEVKLATVIDNSTICNYWKSVSRIEHEKFIDQIEDFTKKMNLNDWGKALFINNIGEQIYQNQNEVRLFTWFVLTKLGYNSRVGYNNNNIYLLLPVKNMMYSTPYLTLDDERYYIITFKRQKYNPGKIYSYKGKYPETQQKLSLNIQSLPKIKDRYVEKNLAFSYNRQDYSLPVKFNRSIVDYFENYPQTDYEIYFISPVSPMLEYSISKALSRIVQEKPEAEAVNIILRFVQTAFQYKTDEENFGREKPLFPEETMYYKYSDCEDRSILFAQLVKKILGLEVVGLKYPGHMSAAVEFTVNIIGDSVNYKGKKYIICDPTYINANAGQCMPQFKNIVPEVIRVIM